MIWMDIVVRWRRWLGLRNVLGLYRSKPMAVYVPDGEAGEKMERPRYFRSFLAEFYRKLPETAFLCLGRPQRKRKPTCAPIDLLLRTSFVPSSLNVRIACEKSLRSLVLLAAPERSQSLHDLARISDVARFRALTHASPLLPSSPPPADDQRCNRRLKPPSSGAAARPRQLLRLREPRRSLRGPARSGQGGRYDAWEGGGSG